MKLYDKNQKETFDQKFYIEKDTDYIKVLEQLLAQLKEFNLEIDSSNIGLVLAVGKNPKETFCLLERVI